MGRISIDDMERYSGNQSRVSFFKLADDGDKAVVRFAHDGMSDIEALAIHTVKVDGVDRKVSCLRGRDDPMSACPFCEEGLDTSSRMYLKVLVYEPVASGENKGLYLNPPTLQIWEKGAGFKKQLQSFINRYAGNGKKLIDTIVEIERNGKKGDTKTQYMMYPVTDLDDDECPIPDEIEDYSALGTIVMDKSFDEMNEYLDSGEFPKSEKKESREEVKRNRDTQTTETRTRRGAEDTVKEEAAPVRRRRI